MSAYYYVTLVKGDEAYELTSTAFFEQAQRYVIDYNIATGERPKVYYHSGLEATDFEVYPLDEAYLR